MPLKWAKEWLLFPSGMCQRGRCNIQRILFSNQFLTVLKVIFFSVLIQTQLIQTLLLGFFFSFHLKKRNHLSLL